MGYIVSFLFLCVTEIIIWRSHLIIKFVHNFCTILFLEWAVEEMAVGGMTVEEDVEVEEDAEVEVGVEVEEIDFISIVLSLTYEFYSFVSSINENDLVSQ